MLPKSNEEYGSQQYWSVPCQRQLFPALSSLQGSEIHKVRAGLPKKTADTDPVPSESDDGSFDWFKSYAEIAPLIRELVPDKASRVLMLGCGNSKLSEEVCSPLLGDLVVQSCLGRCGMMDTRTS